MKRQYGEGTSDFVKYGTPIFEKTKYDQKQTNTQVNNYLYGSRSIKTFDNYVDDNQEWQPSSFKSSRTKRMVLEKKSLEDYMDEEDLIDIESKKTIVKSDLFGGFSNIKQLQLNSSNLLITPSKPYPLWVRFLLNMGWDFTELLNGSKNDTNESHLNLNEKFNQDTRKNSLLKNSENNSNRIEFNQVAKKYYDEEDDDDEESISSLKIKPLSNISFGKTNKNNIKSFERKTFNISGPRLKFTLSKNKSSSNDLNSMFVKSSKKCYFPCFEFKLSIPADYNCKHINPYRDESTQNNNDSKFSTKDNFNSSNKKNFTQGLDLKLVAHTLNNHISKFIPPLGKEKAKICLNTILPYANNTEKQTRYRAYLELEAGLYTPELELIIPNGASDIIWENEIKEFQKSALLFSQLNNDFTSRFRSKSDNDYKTKPESKDSYNIKDLNGNGNTNVVIKSSTRSVSNFFPSKLLCRRFGVDPSIINTNDDDDITTTKSQLDYSITNINLHNNDKDLDRNEEKKEDNIDIATESTETEISERASENLFNIVFGDD